MKDQAYFVVLVHNNDARRNEYAIPRLQNLCATLDAPLGTVSWQPPARPHSIKTALGRDFDYLRLALSWSKYRGMPRSQEIQILRGYLQNVFPKYLGRAASLKDWQKRSFIETAVTSKHILAWQLFLESKADFLICCEDDIVFRHDSAERLLAFLESATATHSGSRLYVDLAGGLDEDQLKIGRLLRSRYANQLEYAYPTTNTACSYLLSRNLAQEFLTQIAIKPVLRLIGIDWMMNAMFMDQRRRGEPCKCIHFSPTIFGHGTLTGEYESWQSAMKNDPADRAVQEQKS